MAIHRRPAKLRSLRLTAFPLALVSRPFSLAVAFILTMSLETWQQACTGRLGETQTRGEEVKSDAAERPGPFPSPRLCC